VSRELVSKSGDSGVRRGTLRFDPLKARFCLSEFGDERLMRRRSLAIPPLFFAGHFHSKVSAIQLRIASQASSRV
jgi:hypothetical protein